MSAPETAAAADEAGALVGRCYTKARRHPLVVGRWPGGGVLLGGPYSVPQLIVMVGSFVALVVFHPVWAHFGFVWNLVVAVGVPVGLGFTVRRLNVDGRNPLSVVGSVLGLLTAPAAGRLGGRPLRPLAKFRPVRGVCTVTWQEPTVVLAPVRAGLPVTRAAEAVSAGEMGSGTSRWIAPGAQTGEVSAAAETAGAGRPRVLSGVGALLAARSAGGCEIGKG